MEKHHRKKIQTMYADLVEQCDIVSLLPRLVNNSVFSLQQIEKYMHGPERERKQRLFLDVPKRGPQAFDNLIKSLRESNHNYLANCLAPQSDGNCLSANRRGNVTRASGGPEARHNGIEQFQALVEQPDELVPVSSLGGSLQQPLVIRVIPAIDFCDDPTRTPVAVYSMRSKVRGAALIINIVSYHNDMYNYRRGAEMDSANLNELFRQMGFIVKFLENGTRQTVKTEILNFKAIEAVKRVDIVFIIIMGHGVHEGQRTKVYCSDNESLEADWVEQQFDNLYFKEFQKKPRVLMFQTCRGNSPDFGVSMPNRVEYDSAQVGGLSRTCSDLLVSYSTIPGFASHRDLAYGTWYITNFCEVVMNHAHNTHLEDLFKLVDQQLERKRSSEGTVQTAMFSNYGFNTCYLNPLIYSENGVLRRLDLEVTN